jgi:nucleoside-diphosphate-sugar epimerase
MSLGKVIVTGANGFIGYNLVKNILDISDEIIAIDNFEYVKEDWISKLSKEFKNVKLIVGDVSQREVWEKIGNKKIDFIFHFGSPSSIVLFNKNPERCINETIFSQFFAFKYGIKMKAKKIIFPSSGNVYGRNTAEKPLTEDIQPLARNLYASSKLACEQIAWAHKDFIDFVGLRITAGYGPGEERKGEFASIVYLFLKDILNNISPTIFGDGEQKRDFVYIEDVISSIINSAKCDYSGIINVGSGKSRSFNEVIKIINKIVGKDIVPNYVTKPKNYVENIRVDISRMKKILNVKPIDIEEGIKMFIKYLKSKKFV